MLETVPLPIRPSIVIAVALGLGNLDLDLTPTPPFQAHYGVIQRSAFHSAAGVHRFQFRSLFSESEQFEVLFIGRLPDTVCPGLDTSLEGFLEGDLFIATRVHGPGCTKGVPCRRYECLPVEQRPAECRPSNKYQ